MIEAKNVSLTYPDGTLALQNINLNINPGELVFITGHSGSGKTSLLKLLMGIEYPTQGSLTVKKQPILKKYNGKIKKLRRNIGPIFQDFRLIKGRTVMDNILVGLRFLNFTPKQMKENSKKALEKVGLSHKANIDVAHLSLGEVQRIAIARAIARKPSLILADEPTGNLDHENAIKILDLLTSLQDEDTTVIITTHATHLIEQWKDAVFINIDNGIMSVKGRGDAL